MSAAEQRRDQWDTWLVVFSRSGAKRALSVRGYGFGWREAVLSVPALVVPGLSMRWGVASRRLCRRRRRDERTGFVVGLRAAPVSSAPVQVDKRLASVVVLCDGAICGTLHHFMGHKTLWVERPPGRTSITLDFPGHNRFPPMALQLAEGDVLLIELRLPTGDLPRTVVASVIDDRGTREVLAL